MKHLFIFIFLTQLTPLFGQTNSASSGNFNDRTKWVAPRSIWDGVSVLNGHVINVPDGKTFYSGKITFTGTGKLNLNTTGKWMPNPSLSTFDAITSNMSDNSSKARSKPPLDVVGISELVEVLRCNVEIASITSSTFFNKNPVLDD